MSCNCGCNPCNCYPSIPNQWNTCPPTVTTCNPVVYTSTSCPPPPPPFPYDGIYTQFARVVSTPQEILNMGTTPKILVPAPGANKMIVPLQIMNVLKFNTTPYQDLIPSTPVLTIDLGGLQLFVDGAILGSVTDATTIYPVGGAYLGLLDNQALTTKTLTQPIVGDSNLFTYITYITITL